MRLDVMVDIETLGNKIDSTIFQIAAIAFDINTGKIISKFNQIADISKNVNMNVTGDTIKWWLNTNKELLTDLVNRGEWSSHFLLMKFHEWLSEHCSDADVYLWGNGILFDNSMIKYQLEAMGLDYPIHYKNDCDVRTIVDLACAKLGITESELKEDFRDDSLVEHDAYDDTMFQINLVTYCYQLLTKVGFNRKIDETDI